MLHVIADWQLQIYELRDILNMCKEVPGQAAGIAAIGGIVGLLVAAMVPPLPAKAGVLLGIGFAVLAMGFNDPQLGVVQPSPPHCLELEGECVNDDGLKGGP
jgi:hypothetical protein